MELKIQTGEGEFTAILVSGTLNATWSAWIKEYPAIVVHANSTQEVFGELSKILDMIQEEEIKNLINSI